MESQLPSTPERHRHAERDADRIRRLQMTSPSHRRNRVQRESIVHEPIPHPQFIPPVPLPAFNPTSIPPTPASPQHRRNLQNPMVHPPALNSRHIAIRNRQTLRQAERNSHVQRLRQQLAELERQEEQHRQRQAEQRMMQAEQHREEARLRREEQQRQREEERQRRREQQERQRAEEQQRRQEEQQRRQEEQQRRQEERERQSAEEQQRRQEEQAERQRIASLPAARRPYQEPSIRHSIGSMDVACHHCHALHFDGEKLTASTRNNKKFGMCCLQGQVQLPLLPQPPSTLRDLLCGRSPLSPDFFKCIRQFNSALAFTSLGAKIDHSITGASGPYSFRVHGELCHRMGSLLPENPTMEKSYAQLYVHDPDEALDIRRHRNPQCNPSVMQNLQAMLYEVNPFIPIYQQAYHIMSSKPPEEHHNVALKLHLSEGADGRRYNLPTANEIAAIVPGNGEEEVSSDRDIILRLTGGSLRRISQLNPLYDPLHYVLLFPRGEEGWCTHIPLHPGPNGQTRSKNGNITQTCYYAYRLHQRRNEPSTILQGRRLFQQWVVDGWASTEQSKLNWIRNNQKTLRSDVYSGLRDAVAGGDHTSLNEIGQRTILPSSHTGSPRHMFQLFQDSMAICRTFHKPDLFITMTCNPNWPEITSALLPGQKPEDRPDIVSRVFNLKKDALLNDIKKNKIFGQVVAMVHTIEFQKRGLPHMHLLIFLAPENKIRTPADVNVVSCAQIPDPERHPLLHKTVTTCMLHGPCGPKCMKDGKCTKNYPKAFCEQTTFKEDGYPEVARPDNGRTHTIHPAGRSMHTFTNCDVVPYNPFLSAKYDCHINVEVCISVKAIKYIHKYIYKGHDRTTLEFTGQDEIKQYLDARYISACECCWRMFEFNLHCEEPNVIRLPVHLPDQHMVYYDPDEDPEEVLERNGTKNTCLTAYFIANQEFPDIAPQYTYQEFPRYFVWLKTACRWKLRQRNHSMGPTIGRMYAASPAAGERFYLRTLLTVVKGATSFEHLRTVDGVTHPTFHAACLALGLLENDNEWIQCLEEAGDMQTGHQLRNLFGVILLFCSPAEPAALWHQFKDRICDDLANTLQRRHHIPHPTEAEVYDYGLYLLNKVLTRSGKSLEDFAGMPTPERDWEAIASNLLLAEQLDFDRVALRDMVTERLATLNMDQHKVYDAVMESYHNDLGKAFFIHSAGGGGKTYTCNTIAASIRADGKVVLCVASSAIAALLLEGGRTTHSRFKVPIPIHEQSTCTIGKQTQLADVIRQTKLIIFDEVPMQHRHVVEALDRSLQDIMGKQQPFGGITILFGGDFRQTLPVIPKGSRESIVGATFCRSGLWKHIQVLKLEKNERLDQTPESELFASWLLEVGSGHGLSADNSITLPSHMRCGDTPDSLISSIYPAIASPGHSDQYYLERTILSGRNDDVDDLNASILQKFPGQESVFWSADSVETDQIEGNEAHLYPSEFLASLRASGLPLSRLALKPGCPLMLLRNLDPPNGLCNGTRMILLESRPRVLVCRILGGKHAGQTAFIPRITLRPSNEDMPIPLIRRQFPVRLAFAMTINKSQGQSVTHVGLDLRTPVFSHGQLYVALSRCTSGQRIKVLFPEGQTHTKTTNIVYPEVLNGLI